MLYETTYPSDINFILVAFAEDFDSASDIVILNDGEVVCHEQYSNILESQDAL